MSEIRAQYVGGSETGVDVSVPMAEGEFFHVHVPRLGRLPMTDDQGRKVPASFRDSLTAQDDWTEYREATGKDSGASKTAAPAVKEGDR